MQQKDMSNLIALGVLKELLADVDVVVLTAYFIDAKRKIVVSKGLEV